MFFTLISPIFCLIYPNYTLVDESVFFKNLVTTDMTVSSLLENCNFVSKSKTSRILNGDRLQEILAFITPWNSDGYRLSLEFGSKFTIIVPVWFQLRYSDGKYYISGDVNETWLSEMSQKHPHVSVVPRLLFEISPDSFVRDFKHVSEHARLDLLSISQKYKIKGIFLECPNFFFSPKCLSLLPSFIKTIKKSFHDKNSLILIDIPSHEKYQYAPELNKNIQKIFDCIDYAFISIYELPSKPSIAPISSFDLLVNWLASFKGKATSKTLLGLPFFGFDYHGSNRDYVFGHDIYEKLQKNKATIKWVEQLQEHVMFYSEGRVSHTVYYPTLYFLNHRFELAGNKGLGGFGFWELAQGMPYFFDLL